MRKRRISSVGLIFLIGLALLFLSPRVVSAQQERVKELEEQIEGLMEEVEALKEREVEVGFEEKVHFHGYGELHYNNISKPGKTDKMDFHRMVIGLTYDFNDWITLDVEVDFEHAAEEMELEFAHLEFLLSESFNLRAGSMLMPVGYLNEFHEPPLFYSVERPYVEKNVIPTTWMEGGVGIFGVPHPDFKYRLYLVGGLDASKFKADSGIRKGRSKVASGKAEDLALVGRGEYSGIPGLQVGVSFYQGDAAQGNPGLGDASVGILEADLRYRWKGLELTGLWCQVDVGDTEKIQAVTGQVIGEKIRGGYVEGAYHLGKWFMPEDHDLVLFIRREEFNTQEEVAASLTADPANDRNVTTFGLAYYPHAQIAIKTDLEAWENAKGEDWHQFNLGFGYIVPV